jgi:hypothetical protein
MALKPWQKVVTPREDLTDGRPLDASEFAVHLDHVRSGKAPRVYKNPEEFFERTFLTQNLTNFSAEVMRRLSGEQTETNAVFNMATQFGGGKTHSLTLLYHLATNGEKSSDWMGVNKILQTAKVKKVPAAATAVFVGTEFDSLIGRGGDDGTPKRFTPWGEIAFQLGGEHALSLLSEHEQQKIAPAGDALRKIFPKDRPCLILMDEILNFMGSNRKSGLAAQFYNFLHNLGETARGENNVVLVVSIPKSEEIEMTPEDQGDYERLKKNLDRLGKAVIMTSEADTSEIIRRRLFEWDRGMMSQEGKVLLGKEAVEVCRAYADWVQSHKSQIPQWFPVDHAQEAFMASYPFHPSILSVFERKWQALPRFQRTRGILRLLALWVSLAYGDTYKHPWKDSLITLGTAPLEDPMFRSAVFEQLGESRLEVAVATDIAGKKESFSTRLDSEAIDAIKKSRLHRKVSTAIFFESNGGQAKGMATVPEMRLAVAEPDLDIGNIETVLETLTTSCYYLSVYGSHYKYDIKPNINKILADRRANIKTDKIDEKVKAEIQKVFVGLQGVDRKFYPVQSSQVPDSAGLTMVVLSPEYIAADEKTLKFMDSVTKECGTSSRTFKSALIWVVADSSSQMREEARKVLAWEEIEDEQDTYALDDLQKKQITENVKIARRDLKESVWRAFKNLYILGKDNNIQHIDLGLINSSSGNSLPEYILSHLIKKDRVLEGGPSPNTIIKNWPPALEEWSTKAARDAFFASPLLPGLLKPDLIKDSIVKCVSGGQLALVAKDPAGRYDPFYYGDSITLLDVEISEDMFLIRKEKADAYKASIAAPPPVQPPVKPGDPPPVIVPPVTPPPVPAPVPTPPASKTITKMTWTGEVTTQKWMNFYTKVLTRFAGGKGLKLTVNVEVAPDGGISAQKIEETRVALRELGLSDNVTLTEE